MSHAVEQETIHLHPEDAISIRLWMDRLKKENMNVFYKDKLTPPPASRLQGDNFILCVQTPFQINTFWHLEDGGFISIDATHNVTHFQDMLLFMIIATSAKINISYSILFHLTTSYSSYFGGKKGISRNKTSFFLLMKFSEAFVECVAAFLVIEVYQYLLCFLLHVC